MAISGRDAKATVALTDLATSHSERNKGASATTKPTKIDNVDTKPTAAYRRAASAFQ
jgi:hypothetical protein